VRAMPIIADERIPLEKLITHKVPVEDVNLSRLRRGLFNLST